LLQSKPGVLIRSTYNTRRLFHASKKELRIRHTYST